MSYRQYCRRYSEWADSKQLTFHIQRYPGVNLELDYAGKQLYLHNRRNPEETTKVTIFIAALTYSDYFYAEGMTECDIRNWIRVNNNALAYFGGVTPTVTPDNCKVAVARNKDWISPVLNKDFQAWAEHNNTVLTPAKVKSPRWKPVVEGHVKIITMHILMDMEDMVFYSLDDLNRVLMEKVAAENRKPFEGLSYSRYDLFTTEEKETLLPLPPNRFEYLERKTVKVAQDFSFTFDKVHYSMPRKYLRQELEIRAGEKEIYVYNKHGDLIRDASAQLHAKRLGDHPLRYARRIQRLRLLDGALFSAESIRCRPQHPCIDRCSYSEIRLSGAVIPKLFWHFALCGKVLVGGSGTLL